MKLLRTREAKSDDKALHHFKIHLFPGALVRGFFEHLVCKIFGVPVEDNRTLRNDEMSGHVEHELFTTARGAFCICFIPAFLCAILAFLLFICPFVNLFVFEIGSAAETALNIVSCWLAFSLMLNSYPTIEDALQLRELLYHGGTVLQKIFYSISFPFLYAGAFAERYSVTLLLAAAALIGLIAV